MTQTTKTTLIKSNCGITCDKGRYFFFDYSIVDKPSLIYRTNTKDWHSYYIHQITPELFQKIYNEGQANYWEVKFNSLFNYGKYIVSVRTGSYTKNSVFFSKLEGDTLTIPYKTSPSDMSRNSKKQLVNSLLGIKSIIRILID
jgi:hypothetical protein